LKVNGFESSSGNLSRSGKLVFDADFPNGRGVWTGTLDEPRLVIGNRQPAPSGGVFGGFNPGGVSDDGDIVVFGQYTPPGGSPDGSDQVINVWVTEGGLLKKVVAEGDPAPGTGETFRGSPTSRFLMNDRGQVAFVGRTSSTSTPIAGDGVWAGVPGDLRLVSKRGDVVEIDGQSRVIDKFYPAAGNFGAFAQPDGMSNDGRFVFQVTFEDGGQALLTAKVDVQPLGVMQDGVLRIGNIDELRERLIAGRGVEPGGVADGRWNGESGLGSRMAADAFMSNGKETLSVGYALNAELLHPYTVFGGENVSPSDVLVTVTQNGDANLDGVVNNNDITVLAGNYRPGATGKHWHHADFNYDGTVDNLDITILAAFYQSQTTTANAAISTIPEPQIMALLGLGTLGILRRRHRPWQQSPSHSFKKREPPGLACPGVLFNNISDSITHEPEVPSGYWSNARAL
jgi:hypothetical protein